jgi:hypothetical protein
MHKRFLLSFFLVFLPACSAMNRFLPPTPPPGDLDAEERAVYKVLLSDFQRENIVLSETTESGFEFRGQSDMPQGMPGLSKALWSNYLDRNDRSYLLATDMEIGKEYTLLDGQEMGELFSDSNKGWDEFYRRYPGSPGITTFSKVGFNAEMTEALVYMGTQLHYLAGTGNLVRLEKQDGVWKVVDQIMLWIS